MAHLSAGLAAAATVLASTAAAQPLEFVYEGRVTSVVNESGAVDGFEVGDIIDGVVALDLGAADPLDGSLPADFGIDLALFQAIALSAETNVGSFEAANVNATIFNDSAAFTGDGNVGDVIVVDGTLPPAANSDGQFGG
ncbi:MAG: hypothetical protein AAFO89_15225, partial [Planctomycetota bacterium]